MGIQTEIQWTDATWNPHHGCHKVSDGCKYCYMFRDKARYGKDGNVVQKSKTAFNDPLKWKEGKIIFTCSWSDFFIEEADAWRDEIWQIIRATPHHTYQILTKRPERISQCLPPDWGTGYENVWLGVTIENDKAIHRAKVLGQIPAKIRFISAEPLLEYIDFTSIYEEYDFHWIILGGESGNSTGKYRFRPCNEIWLYKMIGDCKRHKVAVFLKQLGTHLAKSFGLNDRHGATKAEWKKSLRVQEFPIKSKKIKQIKTKNHEN